MIDKEKKKICDICGAEYKEYNEYYHLKSKKHILLVEKNAKLAEKDAEIENTKRKLKDARKVLYNTSGKI